MAEGRSPTENKEENGKHNWIPKQDLPFTEIVLYAYAADCTPYPTYVLLPTGLHKARTGALVPRQGPNQEIIPLPGMYFFDGWRVEPSLKIPYNLPQTQDMPVRITARAPVDFFFCSNALIALARSLCKCLLAVLITASGADAVTGYLVRCACIDNTIP